MLSIILYGRNDSHGYNLHKRSAISLNCMAEMLTAPDDEIIFVDYNTPDDLPTFPEAIQDTLTARAKSRLRILRLRPEHHDALANRTQLVALESRSRNAAVRRANPANRWMLSTNPDMVFLPRQPHRSLTEAVASLSDGSYHLPRFELPETYWEAMNRLDPQGILERLAVDGQRLHINDVVYGSEAALFDGHGDFQLLLKSDLEAVHGFNEEMINGWHVDSNLAKRLLLLRGEVRSFLDHFFGYHCDHTRMASVGHGRDRLENDLRRFYDDVITPELPQQAETWGLAGIELEEIRLAHGGSTGYTRALEAALTPMEAPFTEGAYIGATYDDPRYPAEHVLPYLCDLLGALPRSSDLAWFGARPRMLALMLPVWRELGFRGRILVPDTCAASLADTVLAPAEIVPEERALGEAAILLFEFGAHAQDRPSASHHDPRNWSPDDLIRLSPVRRGLFQLVDMETAAIATGQRPRRVITINAIHNRCESLVNETLSINRTPFSTRLRQGFVIAEPPPTIAPEIPQQIRHWLGRAMGRRQPVPITEVVRLMACLDELLHGNPTEARLHSMLQVTEALTALTRHPGITRREGEEALEKVRQRLEALRPSQALAGTLAIPVVETLPPVADFPCRLAAMEDWEDDTLIRLARRHFTGMFAANVFRRSRGLWGRLVILAELERAGLLRPDSRILIVAGEPDDLYNVLSDMVERIEVIDRSDRDMGPPLAEAPFWLWRDPGRVSFRPSSELPHEAEAWDAIIFTGRGLFWGHPLADSARDLAAAAWGLKPGGILAAMDQCRIDQPGSEIDWLSGKAAEDCQQILGLSRRPAAAPALSRQTLDSAAFDEEDCRRPHFVNCTDATIRTNFTLIFEKTGTPGPDAVREFIHARAHATIH